MAAKLTKRFEFTYSITEKSITDVNGGYTETLIGEIAIQGVGYQFQGNKDQVESIYYEYDFDIDVMQVNGTDIIFLKEHLSDSLIESIEKEAYDIVKNMFYEYRMQELNYDLIMESYYTTDFTETDI